MHGARAFPHLCSGGGDRYAGIPAGPPGVETGWSDDRLMTQEAAPARPAGDVDWQLLAPLLAHVVVTHTVVGRRARHHVLPHGRARAAGDLARRDLGGLCAGADLRRRADRPLHRPRPRCPRRLDRQRADAAGRFRMWAWPSVDRASARLHHAAGHRPHVPDGVAADADRALCQRQRPRHCFRPFHGGDLGRPGTRPIHRRADRRRRHGAGDRAAVLPRPRDGRALPRRLVRDPARPAPQGARTRTAMSSRCASCCGGRECSRSSPPAS